MKWIHESSDHEIKAGDTEFDHLEPVKPENLCQNLPETG